MTIDVKEGKNKKEIEMRLIDVKTKNEPSHVLIGHSVWSVDLLEKSKQTK